MVKCLEIYDLTNLGHACAWNAVVVLDDMSEIKVLGHTWSIESDYICRGIIEFQKRLKECDTLQEVYDLIKEKHYKTNEEEKINDRTEDGNREKKQEK